MTRLEHVGIAVDDPATVREFLSGLLGLDTYKVETVTSEAVNTHFIAAGGVKLELLEAERPDSAIGKFLERQGEGVHHLAFEVENVEAVHRRAIEMGLAPINPEPKDGADGKRIFFLHPKETYGILIEICQADRFTGSRLRVPMPHGEVAAFLAGAQSADPLLLLHDAGSSSLSDFGLLMPGLESLCRVVAFDAPGHGESGEWANPSHFLRAADKHARAVLDHVQISTAVVAGLGLGAAAAAALAVSYPERVRGLVFIDPNFLATSEDIQNASRAIQNVSGESSLELASVLVSTLQDASLSATSVAQLRAIDCPMLVLGMDSRALPRALRLHDQLGRGRLAVVPQFEGAHEVSARIVADFVLSVPS